MNKAERPMAQFFHINTQDFTRKLKEGGVEEKAAATIAETVAEAIGSSDVATGTQLELTKRELKSEMTEVRNEISRLDNKIDRVHTELKSDIGELRTELKSEIAELKIDMARLPLKILGMGAVLITLINAFFKYAVG